MKTSTKNEIIAGCFILVAGIFGVIGSVIGSNLQNSKAEYAIAQSGVVNIENNNESSVELIDLILKQYIDLQDELAIISKKNNDLENKNNNLAEQNKNLNGQILSLKKDNIILKNENKSPISTESEVDKNNNNSDDNIVQTIKLMDVCPPYEFQSNISDNFTAFKMGGEDYDEGFILAARQYTDDYALINLNSKYKKLKLNIGHVDGSDLFNCIVNIYLDGNLEKTLKLKADDYTISIEVNLKYAKQLKFVVKGEIDAWSYYGFTNLILTN